MQRQTPQRRAILSAVSAAQSPMTAEQIFAAVAQSFPRLALTTVYRSLDAYAEAGLVRRSIYDDGIARYEIAAEHRHFLTCTACKKSVPLSICPFEQLEEQLVRETGFQISGHKMEFFGLCPACAHSAAGKKGDQSGIPVGERICSEENGDGTENQPD